MYKVLSNIINQARNKEKSETTEIVLISLLKYGFSSALCLFQIYIPIYLKNNGISGGQIGILTSVFTISALFLSAPVGIWNDKFSSKKLILFSVIGLALFITGFIFNISFWYFLLVFLLGGISRNLFNISSRSLVMKKIGTGNEKNNSSQKIGIFNAGGQLAYGVTGAIGGLIISIYGFSMVFVIALLICGFIFLTSFIIQDEEIEADTIDLSAYKGDLLSKEFLVIAVLVMGFGFHAGVEKTSFSLFLKSLNITEYKIGIILAMIGITMTLTSIYSGKLIDRFFSDNSQYSLKTWFIGALILSAVGNIAFAFSKGFYSAFFIRFLHVVGDAVFFVILWTSASKIFDVKKYGGASGIVSLLFVTGITIGALLSGALGDIYGFNFSFILAGLITLTALPIMKIQNQG